MDSIQPNSSLNPHYSLRPDRVAQPDLNKVEISPSLPAKPASDAQSNDFSGMFEDDALTKLQGNLEAIAQMAEKALRSLDSYS